MFVGGIGSLRAETTRISGFLVHFGFDIGLFLSLAFGSGSFSVWVYTMHLRVPNDDMRNEKWGSSVMAKLSFHAASSLM